VSTLPITVIIPCYRCFKTIARALESISNQTQLPSEVILVDDFSNDNQTLTLLKELRRASTKLNIRIIESKKNEGPGSARNIAWNSATQPYVAFLDADDSWHPQKLEFQYSWMHRRPEVAISSHSSTIFSGQIAEKIDDNFLAIRINKFGLLIKNSIPTRSVMLRRDLPYRFVEGKTYAEDYLLWLSLVLDNYPAYHSNLSLAYSYKDDYGNAGLTANLKKMSAGVVDTYRRLWSLRKISLPIYIGLVIFEKVKLIKRLLVVSLIKFIQPRGRIET
jgi:glycosyltransferase involved in cell wall biosynthesis